MLLVIWLKPGCEDLVDRNLSVSFQQKDMEEGLNQLGFLFILMIEAVLTKFPAWIVDVDFHVASLRMS